MSRKPVYSANRVTTPIATCSFPALFTPSKQANDDGSVTDVYKVDLLFDKDTDLSALKAIVDEVKKAQWGARQPSFIKSPFKKGVQKTEDAPRGYDLQRYPEYAGKIIITATCKGMPPGVVDHNVQPIIDPNEVYGGMKGRATVTACAYDHPKGGCGVSFNLVNFQKTGDGERFGRAKVKASDDFEPFVQPTAEGSHADMFDDDDI